MLRHSRKGLKDLPNKMDLLKVLAKDEFIKYFKDTFKIGPVKSEIIYFRFKESNFSLDNIPGIGIKTKEKLGSFVIKPPKVNIEDIFINAFSKNKELSLQQIYKNISKAVGGSDINLTTLSIYKNKDNTDLDYTLAKNRQEGFIRTYLEEHSADSRQHWVRGNKLNKSGVALNLFSNDSLKLRNEFIHWKIHSEDTKNILKEFNIKKSGTWKLKPSLSKPTDEDFIVMENELIPRKVGFRNQNKI
jgi:hypothetical protein